MLLNQGVGPRRALTFVLLFGIVSRSSLPSLRRRANQRL